MGKISFHRKFIVDLVGSGDAQLPGRVFRKIFTDGGEFRSDRDDHPYKGINDAWIRVVSRGNSAYRVIYLKERDSIVFYRAGPHSVEDNLAHPQRMDGFPVVSQEVIEAALRPMGGMAAAHDLSRSRQGSSYSDSSRIMKNHESRRLYECVIGRRLIPHKEVVLVSPYVSHDFLRSTHMLGQMFDEWIDGGCGITLITRPPAAFEFSDFDKLESRGFSILYVPALNARTYIFRVDRNKLSEFQQQASDLLVVGSADLTDLGFNPSGIGNPNPQLELSYAIGEEDQDELEGFLAYLAGVSVGHDVVRSNLASLGGTI